MQAASLRVRLDQIQAGLPLWVPRTGLTISEDLRTKYRVRWDCSCHGRVVSEVRVPAAGATHRQMVELLVQKIVDVHGVCAQQSGH